MKIALVHELLTMKGGAERVLGVLARLFPDAPIYTLLYDERVMGDWFPKERVRVSSAHSRLLPRKFALNHHLHLRRFPAAVEAWNFDDFDLVISASSAFAHGIITNGKPKHLCYVHSPARYLWDRTHDVLENAGQGVLGGLRRRYLERVFRDLRTWDAESADRPDALLAASRTVQRRIELYWRRESAVLYPPIDDVWFEEQPPHTGPRPYVLVASTLAAYKRIDLAILACNRLGLPLKIAGTGADERRLRSLAGPATEFLGFQDERMLRDLYRGAAATIFPGDEDFGLVPLESLACHSPVIAFRGGGALETLEEDKTALFFDQPTPDALALALQRLKNTQFDPATLRQTAMKYSRSAFESQLLRHIDALMEGKK